MSKEATAEDISGAGDWRQAGSAPLVLVVDDNPADRIRIRDTLMNYGYRVTEASGGHEGIEAFEASRPDIVLTDILMPEMDGYEMAVTINQITGEEHIPIVFLTGVRNSEVVQRCIDSGGEDFLSKEAPPLLVKAKVDALLRAKSAYETVVAQRDQLANQRQFQNHELLVAEKVHKQLIQRPSLDAENLRYLLSPMSTFNGDMVAAAPKPSGGQHILVGDFTGHGLSAAIGALTVADIFYGMTAKGFATGEIIEELNRKLGLVLPTGLFLSVALIELDSPGCAIHVWNGGLPDVLVYQPDGSLRHRFKSSNLPLGVVGNASLSSKCESIAIQQGDRIYAYSDGIIEAEDYSGEMFGQAALEQFIAKHIGQENLPELLEQELSGFCGGRDQTDDNTLMEIDCAVAVLESVDVASISGSSRPASSWQLDFTLQADALRSVDPLPTLVQMLIEVQGLQKNREQLYTILAELYSNALEHGLLDLDSALKTGPDGFSAYYELREQRLAELENGFIRFGFVHEPTASGGLLSLTVEHNGKGYVAHAPLEIEANKGFSGRGIPLVRSLCRDMNYAPDGRMVTVDYEWQGGGGNDAETQQSGAG